MSKKSESQLRDGLAGVKDLIAAKQARASQPSTINDPALRATKRELAQFLAQGFNLDLRRLGELQEKERAAKAEVFAKRRADAAGKSGKAVEALERDTARRLEATDELIKQLAGSESPVARRDFVNTPFMIWPSKGLEVFLDDIEPSNSKAKVLLETSPDGYAGGIEELSFYFLWTNPSPGYAVIDIDAYLIASGYGLIDSGTSVISPIWDTDLQVNAQMSIYEWWHQPPTSPYPQDGVRANVASLHARAGVVSSHSADQHIFRGYDLRYATMSVPGHGTVVIEVSLQIGYSTEDGHVLADFAGGNYYVGCPGVLIATLA